ncbi:MAG: radical SAM protein [Thermoplasmatales archaeon]|nr:radical SAM protein [Thermoplasmatales archaeon]
MNKFSNMIPMFNKKIYFCNYWITYRCNSKCDFCNFWRDKNLQKIPDARFDDVKRNLEDLKKMGVKFIDFTGGEPLLNKELPDILSYAKNLGFFVKLSTNGFLYPEKAEELKDLPSRIYFSFDTISKNEYQKIRGVNGCDKLIESIKIAKDLKQDICLLYTVTNENIKNISDITNFSKENKITVYIHPCFSYFDNKGLDEQNIDTIKKYFWEPYVRMSLPQLDFHKKGGNNSSKPSCKVGSSTIDIGPDNCLTIPCLHKHVKRVGINGGLFSLYQSKDWSDLFKNAGKYDFCNHCTIDCYFGMTYKDRILRYPIKQNITSLKNFLESKRSKK